MLWVHILVPTTTQYSSPLWCIGSPLSLLYVPCTGLCGPCGRECKLKETANHLIKPFFGLLQVSVPRDLCTPLVLGTNGTLFNLDVAHKGLKVWGGRLAAGAVPPTPTTLCDTSLASDNTPVVRCHYAQGHGQLKVGSLFILLSYIHILR